MLPRKINAEGYCDLQRCLLGSGPVRRAGRRREGREVEWHESELLRKGEMHCGTGKPDHLSEL